MLSTEALLRVRDPQKREVERNNAKQKHGGFYKPRFSIPFVLDLGHDV